MFTNDSELKFVEATRKKGVSQKGFDYDFATLVVSDGLASVDLPLRPDLAEVVTKNFNRGNSIVVHIDVAREGARTNFLVTNVLAAPTTVSK